MSKTRKEIRNEIVNILKRSNIVKSENIRANRSEVYEPKKGLPAISVYTRGEETVDERSQAPRQIQRALDVVVEVVVSGDDDAKTADQLDDLCEQIERKLTADDSLNCKADDLELKRVDFEYEDENIEQPIHSARMAWVATYYTFMPRDRFDQPQKDFTGLDADWTIGHDRLGDDPLVPQPAADQAKDIVNVPIV